MLKIKSLKPTVCNKPLCLFSHEQYGLGVSLDIMLQQQPDVIDLLITLCSSAAQSSGGNFNPFEPFPEIEVNFKGKTLSFEKGKNIDVHNVLEKIPSVDTLASWLKI
jgi:hypothetical protein